MPNIAVNGLGRIGKLVLRDLLETGAGGDIVLLNDLSNDIAQHALLLEFDTVHGRWSKTVGHDETGLIVDGRAIPISAKAKIEDLDLSDIDVVVDCTGVFKSEAALRPYFDAGVKKVIVSAPVKDGSALNIVYGINHDDYDPQNNSIVTAASCTTNCLAPVVRVLHDAIGIERGCVTTIHDPTNTQVVVDRWHKDARRARAAQSNLIPTSSNSAYAVTMVIPELKGKLTSMAVRVPVLNASITDCAFHMARDTTIDEVNGALEAASREGPLAGILGYETRPLVSSDYARDPRSGIVDALSTDVIDGRMVKLIVWYDNEWGYANRLVELTAMVAEAGATHA